MWHMWFSYLELNLTRILFITLTACTVYCKADLSSDVQQALEQVPLSDREDLRDFFQGMLSQGDFASVLLDDKPSSLHGGSWWFIHANSVGDPSLLMYRGFKTWEKYAHLFPMKKFCFINNGYRNGGYEFWFAKKKHEKNIVSYFNNNDNVDIEYHRKVGEFLGIPQKDIEGFCKQIILTYGLQALPYEISKRVGKNTTKINISDYREDYFENVSSQLQDLEKKFKLQPSCEPTEPFSTTAIHHYRTFSESLESKEEWKERVANLYNSDRFLEEILAILMQE